jgi:uncharacterized membrane protein
VLKAVVARVWAAALVAVATRLVARPGGTARFEVMLQNTGNGDEVIVLSSEAERGWTVWHDTAVPLGPFSGTRLMVESSVPADISGGPHTLVLKASVAGGGLATLNLTVEAVLPDVYVTRMALSPEILDEGASSTLRFTVGNSGTDNASAVTVTLYDNGKKSRVWDLGRMLAGHQEDITIRINPPSGNHLLSVVASTPDRELSGANNEAQAEARVRASSTFIPGFGGVMLAAAMAAVLVAYAWRRRLRC